MDGVTQIAGTIVCRNCADIAGKAKAEAE